MCIRDRDYRVVSVIGDGALTGGMAYEALNNAARMKKNFIIVLNDNKMSISENVGGMSRYLNGLRTGSGYNDLKKSVADALDRIPVVGTAMIDKIKRTKNSIKPVSYTHLDVYKRQLQSPENAGASGACPERTGPERVSAGIVADIKCFLTAFLRGNALPERLRLRKSRREKREKGQERTRKLILYISLRICYNTNN